MASKEIFNLTLIEPFQLPMQSVAIQSNVRLFFSLFLSYCSFEQIVLKKDPMIGFVEPNFIIDEAKGMPLQIFPYCAVIFSLDPLQLSR